MSPHHNQIPLSQPLALWVWPFPSKSKRWSHQYIDLTLLTEDITVTVSQHLGRLNIALPKTGKQKDIIFWWMATPPPPPISLTGISATIMAFMLFLKKSMKRHRNATKCLNFTAPGIHYAFYTLFCMLVLPCESYADIVLRPVCVSVALMPRFLYDHSDQYLKYDRETFAGVSIALWRSVV